MKRFFIIWVVLTGLFCIAGIPQEVGGGTIEPCVILMMGDVNINGSITSADIIYMVNYIFKGGDEPLPVPQSADVNCDSVTTAADIIYTVGFVFKGDAPLCDPCKHYPELSDYHAFDVVWGAHQNIKNTLCESGPSDVVWWTPAIPTWEYDTAVVADTTEYSERCMFEDSAATYVNIVPVGTTAAMVEPGCFDSYQFVSPAGPNTLLEFPGATFKEGAVERWGTLRIDRNVVEIRGRSFWFRSPTPLDPSLADRVAAAQEQDPPELTPGQISEACSGGSLNIANCRISDILETRTRCHTNTDGVECCMQKVGSFVYEHSWQYECPDGPLRRVETITFDLSWIETCGSQVLQQGEVQSTYTRTLEVR